MQAIILAAGMGKRLKQLTENNTKCMVKVNDISIIERTLAILEKKGLSRIIIVVGYEGQKLIDFIGSLNIKTNIIFIWNRDYEKTNNIYSLSLAKDYLCMENTLLLESDIVFEESIIDLIINDKRPSLALVDKFESWMDGSCMIIDKEDKIVDFIPGKYFDFDEKEKYYKTVNIYKLGVDFSKNIYVPFLEAYEKAMGDNEYYESVIKLIVMLDNNEIRVKRLEGQKWYEIDDIQDLDIAESIFEEDAGKRYDKLMKRYGGFWRYPHLIDFCYLVNPYFPNEKIISEMMSNYKNLIVQYPSGRYVDDIISSNVFGVDADYIVLGNGAAELIKIFMEKQEGKVGIISPTFNEYKNRYKGELEIFTPDSENFQYNSGDIIEYFNDKDIRTLIFINPDNPSGNYIDGMEIRNLLEWTSNNGIKLLLDESFLDFIEMSEGKSVENYTFIKQDILAAFKNLYVIKSISKSYGVPGLRLGIMATSDIQFINQVKKELSIWNINSFAEYFMQIINKYKKSYNEALTKFRYARKIFIEDLSNIEYLKVYPTQANYVMCEVIRYTSRDICVHMFENGFLIKDLTPKIGNGKQYIRLAIRDIADNKKLVEQLNKLA